MAFSPEGEFHGSKRKQKKNRAKSIREREKRAELNEGCVVEGLW